ncbi:MULTISPECIES: type I-F CRISPR-associated endonuclease Cas1f [unclassified Thioalkalivibrio]|uniref:type I-F CRISPR-associated endonuclease Cas1f n=1 Tax=unclassified Thioalkalivibrio TaxID=2621013 RepID=UPI00035E2C00|nr:MULTISPECIES: type I-F CRISPR-associated endonuclease Cas1f [unclassified Thioalkalivibrio]
MKKQERPRSVILSKRANVFYLERCRVLQRNESVVYLTDTGEDVESYFNIPDRNTAFLLLGTGTSITNSAIRKLSESNVVVGFAGGGGSPLVAACDMTFLLPQDEYRPTEYMQAWMRIWADEHARIDVGRSLLRIRMEWAREAWSAHGLALPADLCDRLESSIQKAGTATQLLSAEAQWAKGLYGFLARHWSIRDFHRDEGKQATGSAADVANGLIDHGNYLAYGYAATALHALGIPYAMPVLHGKTRRGGLVFDVADLVKDSLVLPVAFEMAVKKGGDRHLNREFRRSVIDSAHETRALSRMIDTMKSFCL